MTIYRKNRGGTFFTMLIFIMLLVSSALMYYYFQKSRVLEQQLIAVRSGEQPADSLAANVFNWNKDSEPKNAQNENSEPATEATPIAKTQQTPAVAAEPATTPAPLSSNPIAETEADTQEETEVMTEEVPEGKAVPAPTATPGSGKIESIYDIQPPVVVRTPSSR